MAGQKSSYSLFRLSGLTGWSPVASRELPHRQAFLVVCSLVAGFLCALNVESLFLTPDLGEAVDYLCSAASEAFFVVCAVIFLRRASAETRPRWLLFAIGCSLAGAAYLITAAGCLHWLAPSIFVPGKVSLFSARETLVLLSILLAFRARRALRMLDVAQGLLFILLRSVASYLPEQHFSMAPHYLAIMQWFATFLGVLAWTAVSSAQDEEDHDALRAIALYLTARLVSMFSSNVVGALWLNQYQQSVWSVSGNTLKLAVVLYLIFVATRGDQPEQLPARGARSLLVRNLLPSFLAVGNIAVSLILMQQSQWIAVAGVSLAVLLFASRLVLMQQTALEEKFELLNRNRELALLAERDPLTQLGNRRSFDTAFQRLTRDTASGSLALLLIDADDFKHANDHHGHAHGDQVLTRIAAILQQAAAIYPGSHCSRQGGDEFAILLPGCAPGHAIPFADDLRTDIQNLELSAGERKITVSIGITCAPLYPELPMNLILSCADIALYRAKRNGRNRVECHLEHSLFQPDGVLVASPS